MNFDLIFLMTDENAIAKLVSGVVNKNALNFDDARFRFSLPLVKAIGQVGERGRVMKRYLYWAFDHCSLADKREVIKSMGLIGDRDQKSIKLLVSGFHSDSTDLQAASAHAFGNLRLVPKDLKGPMLKGIESPSANLRGSCLYAINRAIPVITVPLRLIEQTIFDQDVWVRCESLKAVELSKVISSQTSKGIIAAMVEKDILAFQAAMDVLISLGSAGAFAKPILEQELERGNALALEPLWRITGNIAQYRHLFAKLLKISKEDFCTAVFHIGKEGAVAIPTLVDALADPDWDTCLSAIDTISSFGYESANAIPALRELFDHESAAISESAREAVHVIETDIANRSK